MSDPYNSQPQPITPVPTDNTLPPVDQSASSAPQFDQTSTAYPTDATQLTQPTYNPVPPTDQNFYNQPIPSDTNQFAAPDQQFSATAQPIPTVSQPIDQFYTQPATDAAYTPIPAQYQTNGFDANSLTSTTDETPKRLDLKRLLPFIIIGIVGIIVLIIVVTLLFGNKNTPSTSSEKIVLQWWGAFMKPEEVQPIIDAYQTANPNVTIEYANKVPEDAATLDAQATYKTELDRVLKANDPVQIPDIFMVHNDWAGDYEKYVKASTTYTADTLASTFYPAVSKDFAHGGTVYGVPLWMDDFAILYNKDILASNAVLSIPTDWPTFKSLAQNLTKRENGKIKTAGFAAGIASNVSFSFNLANILLFQNGVTMTDSTDKANFSTDADSVKALQFFKDFATGSTATWDATFKNDSAAFLEGNVAMIIAPSYRLREILTFNEKYGLNLDIGIAQVPQLQGQEQAVINTPDYWGNMVALNRPNSAAAWTFLNYLTQSDQLKTLSNSVKTTDGYFGILYPRVDMADELSADQYLKIYNASLPFLKTWYIVKGVGVESAFNKMLDSTTITQSAVSTLEQNVQTLVANKGKL